MADRRIDAHVAGVRRFSRYYTKKIGVLERGFLGSAFSLTQGRVLYELAHREAPTAGEIGRDLGLDAGYLSRILGELERRHLLARTRARDDGRRAYLKLTAAGRRAFARLDVRSRDAVTGMLATLSAPARDEVTRGMRRIESVLEAPARRAGEPAFTLRAHRPGDMGWVVHRHGAIYFEEYGWDARFEALVARIIADFINHFDPAAERCWIADQDGRPVGCVFVVRKSKTVAQLRLLLVEPSARGTGIGRTLVGECVAFARQAGYRRTVLWTNSVLHAARRLYVAQGFRLTEEERHDSFGKKLVGQMWELKL